MINIVLFGPPGSGKGTQAAKLIEEFDILHISTGDLFRYNLKNDTALGKEARKYMDKGELVPDDVTVAMLKQKVLASTDAKGFLFDGFPRTIEQAKKLDEIMLEIGSEVHALIMLTVDEDEIVKRILLRGATSGRADDTDEATIRNRFSVYESQTAPVFHHYDEQDKAYTVDGLGSIEEIYSRLKAVMDHLVSLFAKA
jgi:adenylate kinase